MDRPNARLNARLNAEVQRLYGVDPQPPSGAAGPLVDAAGRVRALVLAVGRPADWTLPARVWQGVQTELQWPAPAIAVSGTDSYQLWFSLAEPMPAATAHALLQALQTRWLADLAPQRIGLWPRVDADADGVQHAAQVPAQQASDEVWSAFVAPDLAPVFAETPWLDIPPNLDGQAELLSRLSSITPDELRHAQHLLQPPAEPSPAGSVPTAGDAVPVATATKPPASIGPTEHHADPYTFLLAVMNDAGVELALRIEAAKALLPQGDRPK